ncbi:MAG TPA: hypothetical protein VJX74_05405 [Blastocatellia bacterium]|nr:hypothetical protein [Blastocatellia bacterium]
MNKKEFVYQKSNLRFAVPVMLIVSCLAILTVGAREPLKGQSPDNKPLVKKPVLVEKKEQSGSPLSIGNMVIAESEDGQMPEILFTVTNKTDKVIIAYAVKHEGAFGQSALTGVISNISPDSERALLPGRSPQMEINGIEYSGMPETMILSVDFVEFADGTRWGPDTMKTGERVDGTRAGARALREALIPILKAGGVDAVVRSLDAIEPQADQSSFRSSEWLDSFSTGVKWMRERVRRKGQDYSKVEKELQPSPDLR